MSNNIFSNKIKPGNIFGELEVVKFYSRVNYKSYWTCLCKCNGDNSICIVREDNLLSGNTKSCGCIRKNMYKGMKKEETNFQWLHRAEP